MQVTATTENWDNIREEYLSSSVSYRELSAKHGVSYGALSKVAAMQGWHKEKKGGMSRQMPRQDRILAITDALLDKIEKSISELDRCIVKNKERTKTVEYDYDTKKPLTETVEEKEDIKIIDGMIDKMGLKQLVSTLKDIKDIHLGITDTKTEDEEDGGIIVLSEVTEGFEDEED